MSGCSGPIGRYSSAATGQRENGLTQVTDTPTHYTALLTTRSLGLMTNIYRSYESSTQLTHLSKDQNTERSGLLECWSRSQETKKKTHQLPHTVRLTESSCLYPDFRSAPSPGGLDLSLSQVASRFTANARETIGLERPVGFHDHSNSTSEPRADRRSPAVHAHCLLLMHAKQYRFIPHAYTTRRFTGNDRERVPTLLPVPTREQTLPKIV